MKLLAKIKSWKSRKRDLATFFFFSKLYFLRSNTVIGMAILFYEKRISRVKFMLKK